MANTFTNATASVGTTAVSLYTCPSSTVANVYALYLSNILSTDVTVDIYVTDSSKTTDFYVGKGLFIGNGTSLVLDKSIALEASDILKIVSSDASSVEAVASIVETA